MKTKLVFLLPLLFFLAVLAPAGTGRVLAAPSDPPAPQETTSPPPSPGQPEPAHEKDGGGTITKIFQVLFDASTLQDAVVNALGGIFSAGLDGLTEPSADFYQLGGQVASFVFGTPALEEIRLSSWKQMRRVAFALLPLTAALTLWASLKQGLYSVTGYATAFEAVTEFVVSTALALGSYWLMDQAIGLAELMTLAIADTLELEITTSVFAGLLVKPLILGMTHPILSMIFQILAFVLVLVFMGSVLLAFLARELVLLLAVALAPVMIMLGAVRPLGWMRGLWTKAFFVFLLLLPVNVLTLGIAARLTAAALDLTTPPLAALLQLLLLTGTFSVLISINTMLGKLVYGAAIQVVGKVGKALTTAGTAAVGLAAGAAGAGALGGLLGGAEGFTGAAGTLGSGGGGLGAAPLGTPSLNGSPTGTRQLTTSIGRALSTSRSSAVSGFGKGLLVGETYRQERLALGPTSPPLRVAEQGIPGRDKAVADLLAQIDTAPKAAAIGSDPDTLTARIDQGVAVSEATLTAVEQDGLSARDFLRETHYLHPGRTDLSTAGREYMRAEAGAHAFREMSRYQPADLGERLPATRGLHARDYLAAQRIVQRRQQTGERAFHQVTVGTMQSLARAVQAQRLSGARSYDHIIQGAAADPDLDKWLNLFKGDEG